MKIWPKRAGGNLIFAGCLAMLVNGSLVLAQGIPSVPPGNNTVTLVQDQRDVTATWLPEPGESVQILVNGVAAVGAVLVPPPPGVVLDGTTNPFLAGPTTSAYPGQCSNMNDDLLPPDAPDFTLSGNVLTATDCGGMAVVEVAGDRFILPQDSDLDGIPDRYESLMCGTATCLGATQDDENPPVFDEAVPAILKGDGIAAFDEYRGFMVSGTHHRTDTRQKDLFVHLVNPQCGGASLLGGGATTFPTDGVKLFENVNTLISETAIHLLGYAPGSTNGTSNEWVDRFVSYTENADGLGGVFSYVDDAGNATTFPPPDDRQINKYVVFPRPEILNPASVMQKGLRMTECVAPTPAGQASPILGSAGHGSANGPDNALIYTQRIVDKIDNLLASGSGRNPFLDRFDGAGAIPTTRDTLISHAMRYFIAMEIGHAVRLTPTSQGSRKENYGYHHAPGTGCNLDQNLVHKIGRKTSDPQTFYMPVAYCQEDQSNARHHD